MPHGPWVADPEEGCEELVIIKHWEVETSGSWNIFDGHLIAIIRALSSWLRYSVHLFILSLKVILCSSRGLGPNLSWLVVVPHPVNRHGIWSCTGDYQPFSKTVLWPTWGLHPKLYLCNIAQDMVSNHISRWKTLLRFRHRKLKYNPGKFIFINHMTGRRLETDKLSKK
jgi:hypothetical protein